MKYEICHWSIYRGYFGECEPKNKINKHKKVKK